MSGIKLFGAALVGIMAIGGLVIFGNFVATATSVATAPGRVIQQTLGTDNIIYNYEWFRTQFADIESMDSKIAAVAAERDGLSAVLGADRAAWASSDRDRWNFLSSQITGMTNQRTTMVAAYNGNASKANRSIFMAGLPATIQ